MKSFSQLSIIIFFLFGLCVISCGQNKTVDAKDSDELEKIYKEYDESTNNRDIKAVEKYLGDDFKLEDGKTTVNRTDVIRKVKENFAAIEKIIEASSKIEKIEVKNGTYFLEVSSKMIATYRLPDGKTSQVEINGKSTDVWVKNPDGWKETKQIIRSLKVFIDGKEMPNQSN